MSKPHELAIRTDRLLIRDFHEMDDAPVHALRSDPETARFMDDLDGETSEQSGAWLQSAIHHNRLIPRSAYNLAITLLKADEVIGWIGFGNTNRYPGSGNYGVGYMLRSDHWGNGYACEALSAVVSFIFITLDGVFVSAWCDGDNIASARVMEKAGFSFIREFTDTNPKTGQPRRCLEYGVKR